MQRLDDAPVRVIGATLANAREEQKWLGETDWFQPESARNDLLVRTFPPGSNTSTVH